jgi:hypothetical protein
MNNQNLLVLNYLNQSIVESQLERANNYSTHLSIAKFDLKFIPEEGDSFKEIMKFIHSFLDYTPIIYDGGSSFLIFLHDTKLHSAVMTIKNLFMSIKIQYQTEIKGAGITAYEDKEHINELIERVHKLYMKSKISKTKEILYATKYFEYGSSQNREQFASLFVKEPKINVYGFFKEAPLVHQAEVTDFVGMSMVIRANKEYISFLKKQEFVYLEHKMVPDIMRADIITIDANTSMLELNNIKFLDNSPVHRKNIRVTPHKPTLALLEFEEELYAEGLVSDISKNSILFTTQLSKIEEVQTKKLQNKKFNFSFHLESSNNVVHSIKVKAMVYKIFGNQIVLNIYPSPNVQEEINEYIALCQNLLLLEIQGKALPRG